MTSNLALNILLGVVCLGFVWFIWAGGLSSGPEGPVGAWIVPVPFLLLLLAIIIRYARLSVFWLKLMDPLVLWCTVAPTVVDSCRDGVSRITGARASTGLDRCGISADRSRRLTA